MADTHRTGGAPQHARDATLKTDGARPRPYAVYERAGEPGGGRSAEDTTAVKAPHIPPRGWSFGGGAIPVLLVVALLIALAAWAL